MTRAGIYVRISQDRTGAGLGVARQEVECRDLCARRSWTVVDVYVDNDVSASTGKRRPQYERMLVDVRAGRLDAVVVWDLDRLTRRPIEIEEFIALADEFRLRLGSVGGDVDLSTDNGRMFARIKGAVARAEVERKAARQRAAYDQAYQAGLPCTGRRAFGYADPMTPCPTEGPVVVDLYQRFLAGANLSALADRLNQAGHTTVRGGEWTYHAVRYLLANPRYAGLRGRRLKGPDGRLGEWHEISGPAAWPGLVPEEQWRAAVAILKDPTRRTNHVGNKIRHLLSLLAVCGVCGEQVVTAVNRGVRQYRCASSRHVTRRADWVDDYVTDVLLARLRRSDAAGLLVAAVDIEGLRDAAAQARERLDAVAADYASGLLTRSAYTAAISAGQHRLGELEEQLAEVGRGDIVGRILATPDPGEAWEDMSIAERRQVIGALMTVAVVPKTMTSKRFDPDSVCIAWVR